MTRELLYTIGQLAEAAGVTARTIRYYTAEGLLPPPDTRGKYARYSAEHLDRLRLIARLKDAYMPLGEIKSRLEELSAEQVQLLLHEHGGTQQIAETSSASEYITRLLDSQRSLRSALPSSGADAPGYAEMRANDGASTPSPSAPLLQTGRAEARPAAPAPQPPQSPGSLLRRLVPQRREKAPPEHLAASAETWQRVTLAPGVELHIRGALAEPLGQKVQQLIKQARDLFDSDS